MDILEKPVEEMKEEQNAMVDQSTEENTENQNEESFDDEVKQKKFTRLKYLLDQTTLYSTFLAQNLKKGAEESAISVEENQNQKRKRDEPNGNGEAANSPPTKKTKHMTQPTLVSGGELRSYQLEGVEWLISLYENGLNGILADEMGLGKTIQCLSLFAHLVGHGVRGPFLIVSPLSTLANWLNEVNRWTPSVTAVMYHGDKNVRQQIRKKHFNSADMTPIIITSYEIAMNDRKFLSKFKWKYIVVDEGHRLKNFNCKLVRELKSYSSANRLLLTGTPLQNNLTELWSLLNFLLPDIFNDLESFQSWFDFSALEEKGGERVILAKEQEQQVISKLHQILRPFLLRRVKTDVEIDLPSKQEKVVHTKLTEIQREYYSAILEKKLPDILSERAWKQIKNKGSSVQFMSVQLRKCCNHPYLFEWPVNEEGEEIVDESLVSTSGKLQLLDRLLAKLKDKSQVLIFSQMTRMLDIIEDYMILRNYKYCRLDGGTAQPDREERMKEFNTDSSIFCFLLSTRAGGLGVNLTAANVVIFYDSDWNPQMDLQAQDRCHRIGQTRDVKIYRLVTSNSIETKILERANKKLKLERLAIHRGSFTGLRNKSNGVSLSELAQILQSEKPSEVGQTEDLDEYLFNWDE